jgi:hypothetical protein
MKAMTANQRVSKQRALRKRLGWYEVRVWVPTKEDATSIQALAQKMREVSDEHKGIDLHEACLEACESHLQGVVIKLGSYQLKEVIKYWRSYYTAGGRLLWVDGLNHHLTSVERAILLGVDNENQTS